jgi:hypothetical protein
MSIEEQAWKESVARRALAALRANEDRAHRQRVERCLQAWSQQPCPKRSPNNSEALLNAAARRPDNAELTGASLKGEASLSSDVLGRR